MCTNVRMQLDESVIVYVCIISGRPLNIIKALRGLIPRRG